MNKRIINFLMVLVVCGAITGSCKKEDNGVPYTYTSQVIVATNSSLDDQPANPNTTNADKYSIELKFSTDGGTTFVEYPKLVPGQKYQVTLYHQNWGVYLTSADSYLFDWSASTPAPNGSSTGDVAEFTLTGANNIKVSVRDNYCAYDPTFFTGTWLGDEVGAGVGGTDSCPITQSGTDPNTLIISNFFGDGAAQKVSMTLTPSTSSSQYYDCKITVPTQTTAEGGVASGSGYYDICRSVFTINVAYKLGSKTYTWAYNFHK